MTDGLAPSITELNDYTSNKVKEEADAFEKGNFREGELRIRENSTKLLFVYFHFCLHFILVIICLSTV